jgi:hypothetical protein
MTSNQIDRAMDQARTERARYLLALCILCLGFLVRQIGATTARLGRGADTPQPTTPS